MSLSRTILGFSICLSFTQNALSTDESMRAIADALRNDARLVCIGDSLSTSFWNRTGAASLLAWPIKKVTAIGGGAGIGSPIFRCISHCSPVSNVLSADKLGYTIERHSGSNEFFTLPVRGLKEAYGSIDFKTGVNGALFEFKLRADPLDKSVCGPFLEEDDLLKFRYLYRAPSAHLNHVSSISLVDFNEHALTFSPINDARKLLHLGEVPDGTGRPAISRHINASALDIPAINNLYESAKVFVIEDSPIQSSDAYLQPAGGVYYKTDALGDYTQGLYYSSLADDSWSYIGFCSNIEGEDTHDKVFSIEQFLHWLDVTTISLNQPIVFMWRLGVEELDFEVVLEQYQGMISQTDKVANAIGIQEVYHLLITPYMMLVGQHAGKEAHQHLQDHQAICESIANELDHVAAVSIYEATEGNLFIGTNTSNDWLLKNGFNEFECGTEVIPLCDLYNGNFLDSFLVHPSHFDAAKFFAAIVGNEIRKKACHTDLVANGIIDVNDLLLVIKGWGSPEGDVTEDGVTDVLDVLELIATWGECWPVQAPFTGQFE